MKKSIDKKNLAQAATELAIFGTILLFVIGGLIRVGFQQSMTMNESLKVLRMAMLESWRTSQGSYSGGFASSARSSAQILLVEDRLSVDAGQKFGTRDRIPFIAVGNGTFSNTLFLPQFYGWSKDLPVFDLIVNGQRFPLTMAGWTTPAVPNNLPACYDWGTGKYNDRSALGDNRCSEQQCTIGGAPCVILFKKLYNFYGSWYFCHGCPGRYDLNFDGTPDVPDNLKADFSWQWAPIAVTDAKQILNNTGGAAAAMILYRDLYLDENTRTQQLDADGDGEDEVVFAYSLAGGFFVFNALDFQEGDINSTYEAKGMDDGYGLQGDAQMYSFTYDKAKQAKGTYYQIEEGKLYDSVNGQFIRTTTRNDHVDIVMRVLKLSRNTGRFCSGMQPTLWKEDIVNCPNLGLCALTNPVEVCVDGVSENCFQQDLVAGVNPIESTCMDTKTKIIYIRSRLKNISGSRWITRTN